MNDYATNQIKKPSSALDLITTVVANDNINNKKEV